jgi:hypothetical protein
MSTTFKLTKKDHEWSREMASLTCREALNSAYVQLLDNHPAMEHVSREALERIRDFSTSKHCSSGTSSATASSLVQLSMEPLLFHTSATLKLKFLLSQFEKIVIMGVRTLFSDKLSAETAICNCSEFLNTVLNVVAEPLATPSTPSTAAATTNATLKTAASLSQTTGLLSSPPPAFLTGQTVSELYQETVLFVCSRHKAGSDAVENAEEAEEMVLLTRQYARHTLVLLVSLGLAADQLSAAAIFKLSLDLVAEIVLAKKLDFDRECEERARNDSFVATSSTADSSSSEEEDANDDEDENDDSSTDAEA